jgi:3-oxoadipate enol-lactonase
MATQVSAAGLEWNVVEAGRGCPLLLVHGFPLDHRLWSEQLTGLSHDHRVIAPDLPGFGKSSLRDPTSMEQMADGLVALLDAIGVNEPIALCGLSMGGYIAWQFMRKYPARVRALIVCDTKCTADTPEAAEGRKNMAAEVLAKGAIVAEQAMLPKLLSPLTAEQRPDIVDAVRQMILETSPAAIAAAQLAMAVRPDATPLLEKIAVPTLAVVGADDAISPPEEMRRWVARIPGAELVVVPAAGHLAPLEQPAAFNAAVGRFLAAVDGKA